MDASTVGLLGMVALLVLVMWGVPIGFALSAIGLAGLWTLAGMVLTAAWLAAAHHIGARFDRWLRGAFPRGF